MFAVRARGGRGEAIRRVGPLVGSRGGRSFFPEHLAGLPIEAVELEGQLGEAPSVKSPPSI